MSDNKNKLTIMTEFKERLVAHYKKEIELEKNSDRDNITHDEIEAGLNLIGAMIDIRRDFAKAGGSDDDFKTLDEEVRTELNVTFKL